MPQLILALFAVGLMTACAQRDAAKARTPPSPAAATEPVPAGPVRADERAYRLLADGSLHTGAPPASGLYVVGTLEGDGFVPTGRQIEGEGPVGHAEGTPGWMELATGQFFGAMTARAPARPYVEGTMTEEGFVPSSRDIVY